MLVAILFVIACAVAARYLYKRWQYENTPPKDDPFDPNAPEPRPLDAQHVIPDIPGRIPDWMQPMVDEMQRKLGMKGPDGVQGPDGITGDDDDTDPEPGDTKEVRPQ